MVAFTLLPSNEFVNNSFPIHRIVIIKTNVSSAIVNHHSSQAMSYVKFKKHNSAIY